MDTSHTSPLRGEIGFGILEVYPLDFLPQL